MLLADLLENAIIATKHSKEKNILVHLGILYQNYVIEVFDSGIPFESKTLKDFGIKRTTTHSNEGGSGIGLMSIYELMKQYKASFLLEKYNLEKSGFTKKISVIFDRMEQINLGNIAEPSHHISDEK